jgi:pimeloyl-ACP methyl ester carboxylesterase
VPASEFAPPLVSSRALKDLRGRLRAQRRVDLISSDAWALGIDPVYLEELLGVWRDVYDWRTVERRVRAMPWNVAGDVQAPVRVVHQRAASRDASVVVLLHGWPDSVLRFEKVLPLLSDVHVLVPALPGYPFAYATSRPVRSAAEMAAAIAAAIADLGYDRYFVSGGDIGTDVAECLTADYPDRVIALHLTDLSHRHALVDPPRDLSTAEQEYLAKVHRWHADEGAYNHPQSTRPNTLAVGLGDSPAGLAAWIVEKLRSWSDCRGDLESVFSRTEVLDWVSAYWLAGSIGTSFAPYAHRASPGPIAAPAFFTVFPGDIVNAPQEFAARFLDVRSWTVASGGGHFDAWERPTDYAKGLQMAITHS